MDVNNVEILKDSWGKGSLFKTSVNFETASDYEYATLAGVPTQVLLSSGLTLGIASSQILGKGSGSAITILLMVQTIAVGGQVNLDFPMYFRRFLQSMEFSRFEPDFITNYFEDYVLTEAVAYD